MTLNTSFNRRFALHKHMHLWQKRCGSPFWKPLAWMFGGDIWEDATPEGDFLAPETRSIEVNGSNMAYDLVWCSYLRILRLEAFSGTQFCNLHLKLWFPFDIVFLCLFGSLFLCFASTDIEHIVQLLCLHDRCQDSPPYDLLLKAWLEKMVRYSTNVRMYWY